MYVIVYVCVRMCVKRVTYPFVVLGVNSFYHYIIYTWSNPSISKTQTILKHLRLVVACVWYILSKFNHFIIFIHNTLQIINTYSLI